MLSEASLCLQAVTVHTEPDQETGSVQGPEALKEILQLSAYLWGYRVQVYSWCTAPNFLT